MMAANAQPVVPQLASLLSNTRTTPPTRPGEHVQVPHSHFKPCSGLLQSLERSFDPLASTSYLTLHCMELTSFIGQHILSNFHLCPEGQAPK